MSLRFRTTGCTPGCRRAVAPGRLQLVPRCAATSRGAPLPAVVWIGSSEEGHRRPKVLTRRSIPARRAIRGVTRSSNMEGYRGPRRGSSLPGACTATPVIGRYGSSTARGLEPSPARVARPAARSRPRGADIIDKGGEDSQLVYARGGKELPHGRERGSRGRPGPATSVDAGGAENVGQAKGRERQPTIPRPNARCMKRSGSPPRCFAAGIVSDAAPSVNGRKVSDAPSAGGVPQG